jgi:hypothetical protein
MHAMMVVVVVVVAVVVDSGLLEGKWGKRSPDLLPTRPRRSRDRTPPSPHRRQRRRRLPTKEIGFLPSRSVVATCQAACLPSVRSFHQQRRKTIRTFFDGSRPDHHFSTFISPSRAALPSPPDHFATRKIRWLQPEVARGAICRLFEGNVQKRDPQKGGHPGPS